MVGLPPLVGFLIAGFLLNAVGFEGHFFLQEMADLGVTLLLFTIGLKLRINELARAEIWAVTTIHMIVLSGLSMLWLLLCREMGLPLFDTLDLASAAVIGFAMSFSSTVFVVKVLETRGDMIAHYGRIAIGILIVQDLAAVLFLAATANKIPSVFAAILIIALVLGRKYLHKLLGQISHGELLVLFGLTAALGGAALFEAVDLKGDLGALVFGVLLSGHLKSEELAKVLFSMKELFLTGFFLSIGLVGLPTLSTLVAVVMLFGGILLKIGGFFLLLSRFKVRTRTAVVSSIALGNYSEFGLIVAAVGAASGWLPDTWLVAMAVLVACSFAVSAVLNNWGDAIFVRFKKQLDGFQHHERLEGDENIDLTGVNVLILGMGRVGGGAYDYFENHGNPAMMGLDYDEEVVQKQNEEGRNTIAANFSSPDFWNRLNSQQSDVLLMVLCSPNQYTNITTAKLVRAWGFKGFISASTRYSSEEEELYEAGVDAVFNVFAEAGGGLAQHGIELYAKKFGDLPMKSPSEVPSEQPKN
jgi:predicted Kef-type K+ transport protein